MRLLKEECAIFLVLFMLNIVAKTTGNCVFKRDSIANELRLIFTYENYELELVRERTLADFSCWVLICKSEDYTEVSCENSKLRPELPLPPCTNSLQPELKLENNSYLCSYNLYSVGYYIHGETRDEFFETYKVCFDYNRKQAVFTINEAYPFFSAHSTGMQFHPDETFSKDEFDAYNQRNIYEQFQKILGSGQTYMPKNAFDERIDRGQLTPVHDFMTNRLMATTFKMVNVIPQFHSIKYGNWKIIEQWARNRKNTPAKVCSGAMPWTLQLPDTNNTMREMYLGASIPIPLWTYKIILNRNGTRTVFLQYNNIHDKQMPPRRPYGICYERKCPSDIDLLHTNYYGYTYCCSPDHFMTNNVPNLKGYC